MLRQIDSGATAGYAEPERVLRPLAPQWQPSRYQGSRRPNIFAMIASVVMVSGLLAALLTMNVVSIHKDKKGLSVFDVLTRPEPPAPPPPPKQPEPVKQVQAPSPFVAPRPLVEMPAPPAQIATSPTPSPPEISIPGPPALAQAAVPSPAVESVGDLSSKMIAATPPRYPHESRRKREQGTVVLAVLLGVDGSVANISVSRSSGFDRLDQAALSAVRRWRWSPTVRAGTAVMVRGLVEIPFILQDR